MEETYKVQLNEWISTATDYEMAASKWNNDVKKYKQMEESFLKDLTIEQLEIYAAYEEAAMSGSNAKKELYRRKVAKILNERQKDNLVVLSNSGVDLIDRREKLLNQKALLDEEKQQLEEQKQRLISHLQRQISASNARSAALSSQPSSIQILSDSLGKTADAIERRSNQYQQQVQMYQMNSSLKDIANAIRGY
jgi:hypothetical protein